MPKRASGPTASMAARTALRTSSRVSSGAVVSMSATYTGAVPSGSRGFTVSTSLATSISYSGSAISGSSFLRAFLLYRGLPPSPTGSELQ